MLNWDDPLATAKIPAHKAPPSMDAKPIPQVETKGDDFELPGAVRRLQAHATEDHVRPGQGVVRNEALMSTAGAAPVVDPNPMPVQPSLLDDRQPGIPGTSQAPTPPVLETDDAQGGSTGLESLEMGAGRVRVDDKKIINCHADLNQLVPFKYDLSLIHI